MARRLYRPALRTGGATSRRTYTAAVTDATPPSSKRPAARPKSPGSLALAPRPVAALAAFVAVVSAAVFGVVASIGLYAQHDWIYKTSLKTLTKSNAKAKAKDKKSLTELMNQANDQIGQTHKGAVIGALILVIALTFVAVGIYRGRYWARWGTVGLWVLCSFTNTLVGIGALLTVGANIPIVVKVPALIGALALIAAVVFVNLPPASKWFALSKPVPAAGAPARRGGLFGPRPAAGARTGAKVDMAKPAATVSPGPDRARTKKRSNDAQAVARGADLARTRAKAASKSRRSDV